MTRIGFALGAAALFCLAASAVPAAEPPAVTYTTESPAVLRAGNNPLLAIRATPDRALYRIGEAPRIEIRANAAHAATLEYRVVDGFGRTLLSKTAAPSGPIGVDLPPGHGYYEIIATLKTNRDVVAEARRSIGVLGPPPRPVGDEPFGLWIQGDTLYPELGVRWIRDGIDWNSYRAYGDRYFESKLKRYRWYHENGIRVLAYPKGHPKPYQTSREVIADTPEAWRVEEEWWTKIVRTLAGQVDAWGVINEPMRGHWKGSDELVVRYWTLMRGIVRRHDPRTPLIGPSLAPNASAFLNQYRDLLALGLGKSIDAVELHTYVNDPENGKWRDSTKRVRDMTRRAVGSDLPVWSTEHGSSATYPKELQQAQHLMRSWLEAKRIGYPVMIWHMFSHPQGADMREVQFGIFRNIATRSEAPPQPRPAAVAYGVMTRQLAGAAYRTHLDHLGPAVHGYVFERGGKAMLALWSTAPKPAEVALPVGDARNVTVAGLFGRTETIDARDGLVRVTADRSPKFISPLPDFFLQTGGIARLEKPIEVLPGRSVRTMLKLTNPMAGPAQMRIEWEGGDGWSFALPRNRWSLAQGESIDVPITIAASQRLAAGPYQLYARVFLNGRQVTTVPAGASVLPAVTLADVRPGIAGGRAEIRGTLHRLDRALRQVTMQVGKGRPERVAFDAGDDATFALQVDGAAPDRLQELTLSGYGPRGETRLREKLRVSFVPAIRMTRRIEVDGALDDWSDIPANGPLNVRWGWDERHLYLAVRVRDAKPVQNRPVAEMWKDDSLQIGIAPGEARQLVRELRPGLQEAEMVELDAALRRSGPALFRHRTVNTQLAPIGEVGPGQIACAARHRYGFTVYELRIPVEQLGLRPLRGGEVLRASLLVNDSDGRERRRTEWFGGIKEAKDPDLFGHLILQD